VTLSALRRAEVARSTAASAFPCRPSCAVAFFKRLIESLRRLISLSTMQDGHDVIDHHALVHFLCF
jgi:hypothetical protein